MIYSVSGERIKKFPHAKEWNSWKKRLVTAEYVAIHNYITNYVDTLVNSTQRIKRLKAAWITGNNWEGGPFQALYRAMGMSETLSGYFAGLFVWFVLEERADERWMVSQEEDIIGKIYDLWLWP